MAMPYKKQNNKNAKFNWQVGIKGIY